MNYTSSECCVDVIENSDNGNVSKANASQKQLLQKISEMEFAVIDLNLFLDTHPYDKEALVMFKNLANTVEGLKYDYQSKFGPLMAWESSANVPFDWVSPSQKWPWELEGGIK